MNNKAIQILRGSKNYDPKNISSELLDGQPFYSKNNRQLYIGDNTKDCTSPVGAANLMPGQGLNSIIQILEYYDKGFDPNPLNENGDISNNYAGGINDIALGICNYTHSQEKGKLNSQGQGAVILGGTRNQNYGEKSVILGGEQNINTSYGGFQAGYRNITGNFTISDSNCTKKAQGTDNIGNYAGQFNIQLGTNNNIKSAGKTIQIGHELINDMDEDVIQLGTTSNRKANALVEIGYGKDSQDGNIHNALVIYKSGANTLSNRCIQINGDTGIGFQPGQEVAYGGSTEEFNIDRLDVYVDTDKNTYKIAPRNTVSIGDNYIYRSVNSLIFGSGTRDFHYYEYKNKKYPTYPTGIIKNVISIGRYNYINNNGQIAIGSHLNMNGSSQIVLGNLNVSTYKKFFVIANGNELNDPDDPDDAPKANIFTLDGKGNAEFGICKEYNKDDIGSPKDFKIGTVTANLKANVISTWDSNSLEINNNTILKAGAKIQNGLISDTASIFVNDQDSFSDDSILKVNGQSEFKGNILISSDNKLQIGGTEEAATIITSSKITTASIYVGDNTSIVSHEGITTDMLTLSTNWSNIKGLSSSNKSQTLDQHIKEDFINTLDSTPKNESGASYTLQSITQTNGKITSLTMQKIAISQDQVDKLPDTFRKFKFQRTTTTNSNAKNLYDNDTEITSITFIY